MINRAAVLLRCKAPVLEWIQGVTPASHAGDLSLAELNRERTVYLISDREADTDDSLRRWIKKRYRLLFEEELASWCTDEALWPEKLSLRLFDEWFEVECHTIVEDLESGSIRNEED